MAIKTEDQIVLRVKRNSEIDGMMRLLLNNDSATIAEVNQAGGKSRSAGLLSAINASFDNIHVEKRGENVTMRYVSVNPATPISIGTDVVSYQSSAPAAVAVQEDLPQVSDIRWPQAPPMVESLGEVYRQPSWFNTMRTMVNAGRHIALSGPPGVGKDTAVQELAAREGRILVTIGGDGGFRRRDLVGSMQIASGRSFFDVAEYASAAINGWWCLLTEVNAADADALMYINAQLAAPYIVTVAGKAYSVHPDFRLFVSYNPGLAGTKPLPPAFKDRFFPIQVPFFTVSELKRILVSHGAPEASWVDELARYGVALWDAHERGQLRYQVTSRRLMDAVALLQNGVVNSTLEAIDLAVIAAIDSPIEAKQARQVANSFNNF